MSADLETHGRPSSPLVGDGGRLRRGPADARPADGPDHLPRSSGQARRRLRRRTWLTLAAAALLVIVTLDVLLSGPLRAFDSRLAFGGWQDHDLALDRLSRTLLRLGQRAWVSPVLLAVGAVLGLRRRQWRPLVVSGLGLLALNVVAGGLKLLIGRSNPYSGVDQLFAGGTEYPGGHASNVVLTWGLICWVLARYSRLRVRTGPAAAVVGFITLLVTAAGLYLDWHWFSDQVGGVLLGAVLLGLVAAADERVPGGSRPLQLPRSAAPVGAPVAEPAPAAARSGTAPDGPPAPATRPHPQPAPAPTSPRVVAVVVTHRRPALLRECLAAVQGQTRPPDAVVVVDNASGDGTAEQVAAEQPAADLLVLPRNTGGAGGFTAGLARALAAHSPDLLWLLDDDCVPGPTALERLVEVAGSELAPALVASRVVWTDGRDHPMNTPRTRPFAPEGERERAARHNCVPIRSASFVSVLVDAAALRAEGLPIADYFLWNDDFELTLRLLHRRTGVLCPASVVEHRTRAFAGPETDPGERFGLEVRNKLWLLRLSPGLGPAERLVYAGATGRRWLATFAGSPRRGVLLRGLVRGLGEGLRGRPRDNSEVLADVAAGLGLDLAVGRRPSDHRGPVTDAADLTDPRPDLPADAPGRPAPAADPIVGSPP